MAATSFAKSISGPAAGGLSKIAFLDVDGVAGRTGYESGAANVSVRPSTMRVTSAWLWTECGAKPPAVATA
jgi:hypothetical protein